MLRRSMLTATALMAAGPLAAQAPLKLYTAGAGSAFLPYGEGIARRVAQAGGPAISVERSAGSLENLARVEDDPGSLGTAFLGSVWDALQGTAAAGGRRHLNLRALFAMYETSFQVAAPRRSGIVSFGGLAGKRVGVGPLRGPADSFFRVCAEANGVVPGGIVGGDPAALVAQLQDGAIDALWQGAIVPIPSLVAAVREADAVVFALSAAEVAATRARLPFLAEAVVPAGAYPGQAAPLLSFGAWNFVVCHAALPDDMAHALCRAVLSAADPVSEIHPFAAATRAANARGNTILPFHPGAVRFHREVGVALG